MKTDAKKTKEEEARKKDSSYPVYDLSEALKVAEAVRDLGGSRSPVAKSTLAKKLDLAEKGPSFFQRVGAAKAFGVIAGWGEYQLTATAKEFFFPIAEGMKQSALIAFLKTPPLFKRIAERYADDTLPDTETLGNVMHMEGVNETWKDRVAGIFARSAQTAGAIDSSGFLRSVPENAGSGSTTHDQSRESGDEKPPSLPKRLPPTEGTKQFNFDFDGKTVSLIVSKDGLHPIQWSALNDFVQSLKPKEVAEKFSFAK